MRFNLLNTKKIYRYLSIPFSLAAVALVYFLNIPNPMMILIIPVVMFSYIDGYIGGIMSGLIAMLYSAYFFSNPGQLFKYSSINVQKILTILLCTSTVIVLVGQLRAMVTKQARTITNQNKKFLEILNTVNVELKITELKTNRVLFSNNWISDKENEDYLYPLEKDLIDIMRRDRTYQHTWEYVNEKNGKWYYVVDFLIDWPGNGECRLQQRFDVTESRENTEQLKAAMIQAEESNKAKSDFLSRMSHEIRTPINTIIGVTQLAKKKDTKAVGDFRLINSVANHLLGIINDILDMSKIEAGKFEINNAVLSLDELIERIKSVTMFTFSDRKQVFNVEIDERISKVFSSDMQRLSQVVANLLSNASKFTPTGKEISLIVKLNSETDDNMELLFSVKDQGIGMTEDQVEKIFKPFEQGDGSISRRFGGTGLGLTISKNIVESMDGDIWVESVYGEGSTFSFMIPVTKVDEVVRKNEEVEDYTGIFDGKKVLLVEDMEINRLIIKSLLAPTKVKIDEAENGEIACNILKKNIADYDLVLMDIQMPYRDGYTATEIIREFDDPKAKTIPIIAMTANVFKRDIERCIEAGMNAHIGKPVDLKQLIRLLSDYIQ